jgi:hypothetical protein
MGSFQVRGRALGLARPEGQSRLPARRAGEERAPHALNSQHFGPSLPGPTPPHPPPPPPGVLRLQGGRHVCDRRRGARPGLPGHRLGGAGGLPRGRRGVHTQVRTAAGLASGLPRAFDCYYFWGMQARLCPARGAGATCARPACSPFALVPPPPPPTRPRTRRVGRTARYLAAGRALLLLAPCEKEGMLAALEEAKVPIKVIRHNPAKMQPVGPALQVGGRGTAPGRGARRRRGGGQPARWPSPSRPSRRRPSSACP